VASRVRVGLVAASPVDVRRAGPELLDEQRRAVALAVERYGSGGPASSEALRPARELYRAFGIDPTRTRPSSEALLRRVLKGEPLPRINSAVDVCNVLSVSFLLPIGLYDAGAIEGPVELRVGGEGESYVGIGKPEVHLAGRPVLADRRGAFGNPTSDSARTSVDTATTSLWMVVFGPASLPRAAMARNVEAARTAIELHLSAVGRPAVTTGETC
jgi:DNA/RNA-binding domain of Phe-tRNA-synthetase-like protein